MSDLALGFMLCLFDEMGRESQVPLQDCDANAWQALLPGVGLGQILVRAQAVRL